MNPLLKVDSISTYYGDARALYDVSLDVAEGEVVAIIGANGAGKTTTLRTISCLIRPRSGRILFKNKDIGKQPAHRLIKQGIAHVPEGRHLFPQMTVRENLLMGAYGTSAWKSRNTLVGDMCNLFPRIGERLNQHAGTMSGGERQMLALARALMSEPSLLMLDEPSLGLAPKIVEAIFGIIQTISQRGVTILLVEQNAQLALRTANRAYVLENGTVMKSGLTKDLVADEAIRRAYLGV